VRRSNRKVRALQTPELEGIAMKCDICDQEVANSEELKAHMEREHPAEDGDDELEKPDMIEGQEQPEPVVRPVR
jgi:hypothetical protein